MNKKRSINNLLPQKRYLPYRRTASPRFAKPSLTELIFETIEDAVDQPLIDIFLSGYGESYRKTRWLLAHPGETFPKSREQLRRDEEKRLRNTFYALLAHLKKNGFVERRSATAGKLVWRLTRTGRKKLAALHTASNHAKHLPDLVYDNKKHIVIFDIPEREKAKRQWLRSCLISFGYTMLQKSVWIGDARFPSDFVEDIASLNLIPHIHIFRITEDNAGTLTNKHTT